MYTIVAICHAGQYCEEYESFVDALAIVRAMSWYHWQIYNPADVIIAESR